MAVKYVTQVGNQLSEKYDDAGSFSITAATKILVECAFMKTEDYLDWCPVIEPHPDGKNWYVMLVPISFSELE